MSAQQLHLFHPAKPLLQRFGTEFFRAVPPRPGVYIMGGDAERILYIGQSRNLRHRLGSYKNARPDRAPRKIIRLVHSVRTIVWEECESPEAARLRENALLRLHRPKFNVQNVYPQAYRFITVHADAERLAFHLGPAPAAIGKTYGAFKGGSIHAHAALLRALWAFANQPATPHAFPSLLLNPKPPPKYSISLPQLLDRNPPVPWLTLIDAFLAGESNDLVPQLTASLPVAETISPFQRNLQSADLETLTAFFEHGPKRNQQLRLQHDLPATIIPQNELDDLLVASRETERSHPKSREYVAELGSNQPSRVGVEVTRL